MNKEIMNKDEEIARLRGIISSQSDIIDMKSRKINILKLALTELGETLYLASSIVATEEEDYPIKGRIARVLSKHKDLLKEE